MWTVLIVSLLQIVPVDTSNSKLFKRITTEGEFVMFDKERTDQAILRDKTVGGIAAKFVISEEMDFFLANHAKEPLRIS